MDLKLFQYFHSVLSNNKKVVYSNCQNFNLKFPSDSSSNFIKFAEGQWYWWNKDFILYFSEFFRTFRKLFSNKKIIKFGAISYSTKSQIKNIWAVVLLAQSKSISATAFDQSFGENGSISAKVPVCKQRIWPKYPKTEFLKVSQTWVDSITD